MRLPPASPDSGEYQWGQNNKVKTFVMLLGMGGSMFKAKTLKKFCEENLGPYSKSFADPEVYYVTRMVYNLNDFAIIRDGRRAALVAVVRRVDGVPDTQQYLAMPSFGFHSRRRRSTGAGFCCEHCRQSSPRSVSWEVGAMQGNRVICFGNARNSVSPIFVVSHEHALRSIAHIASVYTMQCQILFTSTRRRSR